jgi:hypothetical protein
VGAIANADAAVLWGIPLDSDAAKVIDLLAAQSLVNEEIRDT